MPQFLAAVTVIIGMFVVIFLSSVWSGYVLSILWGWFFVPVFKLPELSIPYAIGIALVVGYMTKQSHTDLKKDESKKHFFWLEIFLKPAMVLLIGWIVKQFI